MSASKIALTPQAQQQLQIEAQERAARNQATFTSKQIRINTACAILTAANGQHETIAQNGRNVRADVIDKANDVLLAALEPDFYTQGIE